MYSKIKIIIRYLLFFPSINFKILSAEIFPWAIIYYFMHKIKITKNGIIISSIIIINLSYGVFYYEKITFEIIRSLFAYLNVILIFSLIMNFNNNKIIILLSSGKKIFVFLLILALFQSIGFTNNFIFESIIENIMQRGNVSYYGGGRGISLLSTEPSRAAMELTFIYLLFRYIYIKKWYVFFDLLMLIVLIFLIKSATGLFYFSLFLILVYFKNFLYLLVFFIALLSFIYLFPNINIEEFQKIRALSVLLSLINTDNLTLFIEQLFNLSGFRLISVYSSYIFGLTSLFGGGIGYWEYSSVYAMTNSGINAADINYFLWRSDGAYTPIRPTSFVASLLLDFGLMALIIIFYLFKDIVVTLIKNKSIRVPIILFFIYVFFYGTIGNPIPWIVIALIIKSYKLKIGD